MVGDINYKFISEIILFHIGRYLHFFFLSFFNKDFIYLFLERGEGEEKERERNINVWLPLEHPP